MNKALLSSNSMEWATPQPFFDELNKEFNFTLDPCATDQNAKCRKYFTKNDDGLAQSWCGETVFCNPPYGRQIGKWVEKAYNEAKRGTTVVMLIPARTDTTYFHDYIYKKHEIRFIRGRLYFGDGNGRAPFPSMLVIMRNTPQENEV
ncbi:MAG: adenine methyltransferase [Alphaproteobacteria bacterium]|nr:adenine methyltransferase [Alphaproteobacteria bacterium]